MTRIPNNKLDFNIFTRGDCSKSKMNKWAIPFKFEHKLQSPFTNIQENDYHNFMR